ncbi:MAG TPA: ATPase [Brevundimonas sp.]|jgi:two-component system phosphate regulon sensor histidine kinase PhoR|uniref:sensor histidine kinase n=1 Tax=Brevundimonas aurantiaca TaxID=74316 RepID=UPI000C8A1EDC|nr:ATPase [Brevundimonas sp.]MBU2379911.1 PAS domain-containing protein [Alphaproteobacteria bacterium]MEC7797137.1 ATP-binding protein [Pseudomonadota bacterium]MED5538554.1 ATP-binding protein [Pseudomonadota bacterium]HAF80732.1 ATPase [Brevundimonas sp.]
MSYDSSPSPVAPTSTSRLWTVGISIAIAVGVLLGLAFVHPQIAGWLVGGAVVVAGSAWLLNAQSPAPAPTPTPEGAPADGPTDPVTADLLDRVFESLDDPVLIVSGGEPDDIAGRRIVMANKAARDLLRIHRQGALLVQVIREPGVLEAVDEALFGDVSRTTDYTTGGQRDRRWRAWTRPLSTEAAEGRDPLALVVLRDETAARRTEMMRVDFLANASHELRTPLASLSGFIETLKGHARDDAAARDRFLDIMSAQADRMGRLVADLLSLSRIELNEHIPPSGRVDLDRAAADVVDAVSILTQAKQIVVALDRGETRASINGDRDEILQVVQNLLDNAVKYSPAGGTVEISVRSDLSFDEAWSSRMPGATRLPLVTPDRAAGVLYAAVTVRDHGPGMAREHLPRLTERFYRVEGQKSGERQGTGLGLAIVKHIVNRHEGGLVVESAPGLGAAFTAWFPMVVERRDVRAAS